MSGPTSVMDTSNGFGDEYWCGRQSRGEDPPLSSHLPEVFHSTEGMNHIRHSLGRGSWVDDEQGAIHCCWKRGGRKWKIGTSKRLPLEGDPAIPQIDRTEVAN